MRKLIVTGMVVFMGAFLVLSGQSRADDNGDNGDLLGTLLEIKGKCEQAADAAADAAADCAASNSNDSSCSNACDGACQLACARSYEQHCGDTAFACGDAALSCEDAAVECGSVSVSQTCKPDSPELEAFCAPYIDLLSQLPTLGTVLDDLEGTICKKLRHKEKRGRVWIRCKLN